MENLRKQFTKEKDIVGRVKPNGHCKKHPKHRQSPGVCSLCLREKLTQLSASTSRRTTSSSSSSSSSSASSLSSYYSSSSSASSCASPVHCFRFVAEGKSSSSVSFFMLSGKHGIIKSKSLALIPRRRSREGGVPCGHNKSASRTGFCFKLLHTKSKRMKDTEPVRSMSSIRETVTATS
ncbi:uncharacterized protein LOC133307718 [Gastrolobium bilobum]|uniref:uncharacterized protein LOC133307718 n=1 Tax=Gastrolobium bilobum TaxID=150636 RepID=UPI002AB17CD6|nr:uncharacterized protein LOC133307718 [Gastrolobium bilobum]